MNIEKKTFGVLSSGEDVSLYTLSNGEISLSISTLGASWVSLYVPSAQKGTDDILLGYSTLSGYANNTGFLGVSVGRFANRISGASFTLDGKTYKLAKNDGNHTLHGGRRGFDKHIWNAQAYEENGAVYLALDRISADGEEGFPGTMQAKIVYGIDTDNRVLCRYSATLDAPSPVNFTNHAYFNLKGEGNGGILDHELTLYSSRYVCADKELIPDGSLQNTQGSPFDFKTAKTIGRDIAKTDFGYDHCFVVDGNPGTLRPCAEVFESGCGRRMKISTTQPGVQLYTSNFLDSLTGKPGSVYNKHAGFCLETQHYPDSPNRPEFPCCIFGPDRAYDEQAIFSFEW